MKEYNGLEFEKKVVRLGGARWKNCMFRHCVLHYDGEEFGGFEPCVIEDCQWTFEGEANNTLYFLASAYKELGILGDGFVTSIIDGMKGSFFDRSYQPSIKKVSA